MREVIIEALAKVAGLKPKDIHLETPEREEFGDYSSNVALQLFEQFPISNFQLILQLTN